MAYLQLSATEMADRIVIQEENYTLSFNCEIRTFINRLEKDYKHYFTVLTVENLECLTLMFNALFMFSH